MTSPQPTECTYCGLSFAHEHVEGGTPKEFFNGYSYRIEEEKAKAEEILNQLK